ncbi:MAG: hypothetical protein HQ518_24670 [Rhodopirellula sp.]|nr:hypothetical protein [Rhodopirellula sp.]
MVRATLPWVLVLTSLASSAALASDEPVPALHFNSSESYGEYQECPPWDVQDGFVHRLFNFRPWTFESRLDRSVGTPGLPRGRRYYGGRYFGQFNNRYYGPQYGNF